MKKSALLVMEPGRRQRLLQQLRECGMEVLPVSDCEEARRILEGRPPVRVVLTDEALQDGSWSDVMAEVWRNQVDAEIIVCTRGDDPSLWLHVLARGAYDLLVEPYDSKEVRRIMGGAVGADQSNSHASAA